jgi:hypothetical protein
MLERHGIHVLSSPSPIYLIWHSIDASTESVSACTFLELRGDGALSSEFNQGSSRPCSHRRTPLKKCIGIRTSDVLGIDYLG